MKRAALVAAAIAWSAAAAASPCRDAAALVTIEGAVSAGARCGEVVLASDAAATDRARVRVAVRGWLGAEVDLAFSLRQLTGDSATFEIALPAGYVIFHDGEIGLYVTEAQWSRTGMQPLLGALAARRIVDGMAVRVREHGDRLEVWLDGVAAAAWPVTDPKVNSGVTVAVTGARGRRTRAVLADLTISPPAAGTNR